MKKMFCMFFITLTQLPAHLTIELDIFSSHFCIDACGTNFCESLCDYWMRLANFERVYFERLKVGALRLRVLSVLVKMWVTIPKIFVESFESF